MICVSRMKDNQDGHWVYCGRMHGLDRADNNNVGVFFHMNALYILVNLILVQHTTVSQQVKFTLQS